MHLFSAQGTNSHQNTSKKRDGRERIGSWRVLGLVQGKGETYGGMGHWHPSLSAGELVYGLALLFGYTERHNLDTQPLRLTTTTFCLLVRPHEAREHRLIPARD